MVGPFELGKCVGKGATASVYLAHEPNMRKEVAIKVLKHSQNSVKSIRHEVTQAAQALLFHAAAFACLSFCARTPMLSTPCLLIA